MQIKVLVIDKVSETFDTKKGSKTLHLLVCQLWQHFHQCGVVRRTACHQYRLDESFDDTKRIATSSGWYFGRKFTDHLCIHRFGKLAGGFY